MVSQHIRPYSSPTHATGCKKKLVHGLVCSVNPPKPQCFWPMRKPQVPTRSARLPSPLLSPPPAPAPASGPAPSISKERPASSSVKNELPGLEYPLVAHWLGPNPMVPQDWRESAANQASLFTSLSLSMAVFSFLSHGQYFAT